jgi:hypothetical protein
VKTEEVRIVSHYEDHTGVRVCGSDRTRICVGARPFARCSGAASLKYGGTTTCPSTPATGSEF